MVALKLLETFETICTLKLDEFRGVDPEYTFWFLETIPDQRDRMEVAKAIIKDELIIEEAIPPPDSRETLKWKAHHSIMNRKWREIFVLKGRGFHLAKQSGVFGFHMTSRFW